MLVMEQQYWPSDLVCSWLSAGTEGSLEYPSSGQALPLNAFLFNPNIRTIVPRQEWWMAVLVTVLNQICCSGDYAAEAMVLCTSNTCDAKHFGAVELPIASFSSKERSKTLSGATCVWACSFRPRADRVALAVVVRHRSSTGWLAHTPAASLSAPLLGSSCSLEPSVQYGHICNRAACALPQAQCGHLLRYPLFQQPSHAHVRASARGLV